MIHSLSQRLGRFGWLAWLVGAIWVVVALNVATGYAVNSWLGLDPRDLTGLVGIPMMPFLHGSIGHAAANTPPLMVFGVLMGLSAPKRLLPVSLIVVLGGGFAVWLLGRDALHVGASGLVFGWFGYLIGRGVVERSLLSITVAVLVILIYGAMIWGVLPLNRHISWEAHLFGALAGAGAAVLLKKEPESGAG